LHIGGPIGLETGDTLGPKTSRQHYILWCWIKMR
jgi:hypothetical protein